MMNTCLVLARNVKSGSRAAQSAVLLHRAKLVLHLPPVGINGLNSTRYVFVKHRHNRDLSKVFNHVGLGIVVWHTLVLLVAVPETLEVVTREAAHVGGVGGLVNQNTNHATVCIVDVDGTSRIVGRRAASRDVNQEPYPLAHANRHFAELASDRVRAHRSVSVVAEKPGLSALFRTVSTFNALNARDSMHFLTYIVVMHLVDVKVICITHASLAS